MKVIADVKSLKVFETKWGSKLGIYTGENQDYVFVSFIADVKLQDDGERADILVNSNCPFYQWQDNLLLKRNLEVMGSMRFEVMEAFKIFLGQMDIELEITGVEEAKKAQAKARSGKGKGKDKDIVYQ